MKHKTFLYLFLAGVIMEISQVGSGLIDGLVISRYLGTEAIAAEGIVHPIYSILGVISGLLAVGMQLQCSKLISMGDKKKTAEFFSGTVYVGLAVAVIMSAAVIIFAEPIVIFLGADGYATGLVGLASEYITSLAIGFPPLILTAILAPAIQLDSGRKTIQTGAVIEVVMNIILDIVVVKLGYGVFAVGLVTSVSSYLCLIYQCTHFLRKDRILRFVVARIPVTAFLQMLFNGSEKAIRRITNIVRPIILNSIIIAYGGSEAMAALSIRNSFSNFSEIIGAGIASAVSLMVGLYYAEKNEEAIKEVKAYSRQMILKFTGAACMLIIIFSWPVAGLYVVGDPKTFNLVTFALCMVAFQCPLRAILESRMKYLQAIQRKKDMLWLILGTQLIFVIIAAVILGKLFGVYGILACYTVGDAVSLIAIYLVVAVKSKKIVLKEEDYLNLPEEFHIRPEDYISLDIRDKEDISLASEQIELFCRGHGIDEKTGLHAAVAFEEVAVTVMDKEFAANIKECPIIDLRVLIADNSLIIKLCDNLPKFDFTRQIQVVDGEEDLRQKNLNVHMVSRLVSEISYMRVFETNNTVMKFNIA